MHNTIQLDKIVPHKKKSIKDEERSFLVTNEASTMPVIAREKMSHTRFWKRRSEKKITSNISKLIYIGSLMVKYKKTHLR